jgi:hypothetical protein
MADTHHDVVVMDSCRAALKRRRTSTVLAMMGRWRRKASAVEVIHTQLSTATPARQEKKASKNGLPGYLRPYFNRQAVNQRFGRPTW